MGNCTSKLNSRFPKPFKIGQSFIGWFEHDVDSWLIGRSQS
ncbi:TPA: AlpA family phage regulatory protein [Aeromonas hydrophila subsp. hydrophila]|nr:AlpA family phage regulatory protein [Aeromonas hydrophila subsp. hydrophila]